MKNNLIKRPIRKTKTILILTFFIFTFITHLYAADIQCIWTGVEKIVAVGDLHGDYENFITILKGTGLIDDELRWTGCKTHLVQIGDVMDKGDYAKEILDLLMRLEKEAEEAGGKVHMLIGNHEEKNIIGIAFDYEGDVTLRQFVSFLPDEFREKNEEKFMKKIADNPPKKRDSDPSKDKKLSKYWKKLMRSKKGQLKYYMNFNEKYGKWILEHNVVIKINDIIFVHGGISENFSTWKLEDINDRARVELHDLRRAHMNSTPPKIREYERKIVYNPNGPYWYRDFALRKGTRFTEKVDRILDNLNAQNMVIAHTPILIKSKYNMQRFQGRIWIIDTGIAEAYRAQGGRLSALIIENGEFDVWGLNNEK